MSGKKNSKADSGMWLDLRPDGTIHIDAEEHARLIGWTDAHKLRVRLEVLPAESQDDSLSVMVGEALTVGL